MRTYVRKTILLAKHNIINIRLCCERRQADLLFLFKKDRKYSNIAFFKTMEAKVKLTRAHHDVSLERHTILLLACIIVLPECTAMINDLLIYFSCIF